MTNAVGLHQAHGLFGAGAGSDRVQVRAHHLGNICGQRIAPLRHHPSHEVTFGEDADQLGPVEYRNCAHVALHHIMGGLKDGLIRLDVMNCAIAQQVPDGRHSALHAWSCPGEPLPSECSMDQYSGSPTTPVNSSCDFCPVPWGEPDPWERGAKASIFRTPSRCEAEFQAARAENPGPQQPVSKPITRWSRNLQSSTGRNTRIQPGRKRKHVRNCSSAPCRHSWTL